MAIESLITFIVRCDRCTVALYAPLYVPQPTDLPATHFPTPLAAIHRAIEQRWTIQATAVHCPTCTATMDAQPKET